MTQPRRPVLHHRPLVERLEPRLPPGDTLLGLLLPRGLFDTTAADSSFILLPSSAARLAGAKSAMADEAADDPPRPRQVNRGVEDSAPATPQEYVANWPSMWPRSHQGAIPVQTISFNKPTRFVAAWPDDQGVVPGGATTSRALTSFPNSGSGTVVRETPFRRPAGDETEFPGPAFPNTSSGTREAADAIEEGFGSVPFYFEQNMGQADPSFDFVARGSGYTLGLSATEAVMALPIPDDRVSPLELDRLAPEERAKLDPTGRPVAKQSESGAAPLADARGSDQIHMQIVGANHQGGAAGVNPLVTRVNYFIGNDPNQWHTNVPTFAEVRYDDVYPGIDLVYYGASCSPDPSPLTPGPCLEYDFIVAPHVDLSQVQLRFTGVDSAHIDAGGDLVHQVGDNEIRQQAPYIYQELNGSRQVVTGNFVLGADHLSSFEVSFDIGEYDRSLPLIIDPVVAYSTYLGGSKSDPPRAIAVDAAGHAYVAGLTKSLDFPLVNPYQGDSGGDDCYVAKLSADGSTLLYATYVGGSGWDDPQAIAIDPGGNAYLTGFTQSHDFPVQNAFQSEISGNIDVRDAFVTKLGPTGGSLVFSTFLGGSVKETGTGIAADAGGSAYVVGHTDSIDFPTVNALDAEFAGGSCNNGSQNFTCHDLFITKFTPDGSEVVYSTYLGGTGSEGSYSFTIAWEGGIAVNDKGNAFVTGQTDSLDFPVVNALQNSFGGGYRDVFISKLTPDGSALVYSTYLGGSGSDQGFSVAIDPTDSAYLTGVTWSADFPTTINAYQTELKGNGDAFVSKLAPNGSALVYSTYLGGTDPFIAADQGFAIATDQFGNAYVCGETFSPDFPLVRPFQSTYEGSADAFLTKIAPNGEALVYSSFVGGTGGMIAVGVASDHVGNSYVASDTYLGSAGGGANVMKISERAFKQPLTATPIAP